MMPAGQRSTRAAIVIRKNRTLAQRLIDDTVQLAECGCIIWLGLLSQGYGRAKYKGKSYFMHKVAYELAKGPLPPGTETDHKCRVTSCVNPDHLEAVSHRENTLRGQAPTAIHAKKTHCVRGHSLPPVGSSSKRQCKECVTIRNKENWAKRKAASPYRP